MKIGILIKGNSKKSKETELLISRLKASNFEIIPKITSDSADHVSKLDELIKHQCDLLIAAGGDGTLHQCINAIFKAKAEDSIKLAHFPIGTANDFAKSTNTSHQVEPFIEKIKNNQYKRIDIGKIDLYDPDETHYFINIADAGIGGEIIHGVNKGNKRMGGITYSTSIIKGLITYKRKEVQIKFDSENYEGKLLSLVMANGSYFANGLKIAPHANLNNGKLAITLFGNVTLLDYFRNIRKIKKGKFLEHPEVKYIETTTVEIKDLTEKECHLEADGEYIGTTKATITILPSQLNYLV